MSTQAVKPLIAPFQQILMKKGKCAGCLRELKDEQRSQIDNENEKVICKCNRVYIHHLLDDTYRRARIEEA